MSIDKARSYYLGKNGYSRLDCCRSIAKAFQERFAFPEGAVDQLGNYSFGRAPQGQCGALYAAQLLLKGHQDEIRSCETALALSAGAIGCREIRRLRKLSCAGCVETIAAHLERSPASIL